MVDYRRLNSMTEMDYGITLINDILQDVLNMLRTTDGSHLATRDPWPCATFPTSDVVGSTPHSTLPLQGLAVKHASAGIGGTPRGRRRHCERGTTCCPLLRIKNIPPRFWGHLRTHIPCVPTPSPPQYQQMEDPCL